MSIYGIFEDQPIHLLYHVLDRTPYTDLISLSQTSPIWFNIVKDHIKLIRFQKKAIESKKFFEMGQLFGSVLGLNEFKLVERFSRRVWETENNYFYLGDIVRGFCSMVPEEMDIRVKKSFDFLWNLVQNLDELVKKSVEDLDFDLDDIFENGNLEKIDRKAEQKMELRRELHSLFMSDRNSETYGFFFFELMKKIRVLLDDDKEEIVLILHILLNPIVDGDEYIKMGFIETVNINNKEQANKLIEISESLRKLQKVPKNQEYSRSFSIIFELFLIDSNHFQKSFIFAQEPSLLEWYLYDHSFLVVMSSGISKTLLLMALKMEEIKSKKLDELKSALSFIKSKTLLELHGEKHLMKFHEKIENALDRYTQHHQKSGESLKNSEFFNSFHLLIKF